MLKNENNLGKFVTNADEGASDGNRWTFGSNSVCFSILY